MEKPSDVPSAGILDNAGWKSESIFAKFYDKTIVEDISIFKYCKVFVNNYVIQPLAAMQCFNKLSIYLDIFANIFCSNLFTCVNYY